MTTSTEQQILDGQTWEQFCDLLKRAGQQILRPEAPAQSYLAQPNRLPPADQSVCQAAGGDPNI